MTIWPPALLKKLEKRSKGRVKTRTEADNEGNIIHNTGFLCQRIVLDG